MSINIEYLISFECVKWHHTENENIANHLFLTNFIVNNVKTLSLASHGIY